MDSEKSTPEIELNLIDILRIIYKRRVIVTVVFLILLPLCFFYIYTGVKKQKPVYVSVAKISLGPQLLEVTTGSGSVVQRKYTLDDEINLLGSFPVMRSAAEVLKTDFGYEESEKDLESDIRRALSIRSRSSIGISTTPSQNIIAVMASAGSPKKAYDIVTAFLKGYQNYKNEEERKFLLNVEDEFNRQVDSAYKQLLDAEKALAAFISDNGKIIEAMEKFGMSELGENDVVSAIPSRKLVDIKSRVAEAKKFLNNVANLAKEDKMAAFSLLSKKYNNLINASLGDMLIAQEKEINSLLLVNEEAHPEVIKARSSLENTRKKIDAEIQNAVNEIMLELEDMNNQENELSQLIQSGLSEKLITYNMLKKDIIIKQGIYNKASEMLKSMDLGDNVKRYSEIRVLEPPEMPRKQSVTLPFKNMAFSFVLILFVSLYSGYFVETLDKSIKNVEELEQVIELPVLATIPLYKISRKEKPAILPKEKKD